MRGTPFLSHWKYGVPVTPLGREREQVRVTVAPAMTGDEGEELSEMVADSVREIVRDEVSRIVDVNGVTMICEISHLLKGITAEFTQL